MDQKPRGKPRWRDLILGLIERVLDPWQEWAGSAARASVAAFAALAELADNVSVAEVGSREIPSPAEGDRADVTRFPR
jgi:hypothetical protein